MDSGVDGLKRMKRDERGKTEERRGDGGEGGVEEKRAGGIYSRRRV